MNLEYIKEDLLYEVSSKYIQIYNTPVYINGMDYELRRLYEIQFKIAEAEKEGKEDITQVMEDGFLYSPLDSARATLTCLKKRLKDFDTAYEMHKNHINTLTSLDEAREYNTAQFWP